MATHLAGLTLRLQRVAAIAFALVMVCSSSAHAAARTPSISGNWLAALAIAIVAVWALILIIRGVLYLDERDAWLRRGGGSNGNDYWISD